MFYDYRGCFMAYRIMFVGGGDAGREVIAKAILDDRIRKSNTEGVEVKARGTVVLFQEPVNTKVAAILKNNNVSLEYDCIFQLEQADVDESDLIITMDETQKQKVASSFSDVKNLFTIKEWAGEEGVLLDPYGKELIDYEYCFREIERLIDRAMSGQKGFRL